MEKSVCTQFSRRQSILPLEFTQPTILKSQPAHEPANLPINSPLSSPSTVSARPSFQGLMKHKTPESPVIAGIMSKES